LAGIILSLITGSQLIASLIPYLFDISPLNSGTGSEA
jgi:hypothetical protein